MGRWEYDDNGEPVEVTEDYPNERDCEHGSLRRSCLVCEYQQEIATKDEEIAELHAEVEGLVNLRGDVEALGEIERAVGVGDFIAIIDEFKRLRAEVERLSAALAKVPCHDSFCETCEGLGTILEDEVNEKDCPTCDGAGRKDCGACDSCAEREKRRGK